MKVNSFILAVIFIAISFIFFACEEKGGSGGVHIDSDGSFSYGGQSYKTVVIGTQTWMAENLNYDVSGSVCYDNDPSNCETYGRLYDWEAAMTVCPKGWILPTNEDWDKLFRSVDGAVVSEISGIYDSPTAGRYLKATSGWYNCGPSSSGNSYLCEDSYGFAALPGGLGYSAESYSSLGSNGYWWSASEDYVNYAYLRDMYYYLEHADYYNYDKNYLFSVRCLKKN